MKIEHRNQESVCILHIEGNIAFEKVGEVKNYVKPLLSDDSISAILINFEEVEFIDSSGIGLLVSVFKTLQQRQAKLILSDLSKKNSEIFNMTRLDKIISIYPTEDEALASL